MGVILWPRTTAGKTQSRLEQSLSLGGPLVMDLLTVAPKGATEQDLALGSQSCSRQMQHWSTRPVEQMEMTPVHSVPTTKGTNSGLQTARQPTSSILISQ